MNKADKSFACECRCNGKKLLDAMQKPTLKQSLHYECGVLVYDSPVVEYLFEDMDNIMEVSRRITYEEWEKRKWSRKVAEKFLRFFALWM